MLHTSEVNEINKMVVEICGVQKPLTGREWYAIPTLTGFVILRIKSRHNKEYES